MTHTLDPLSRLAILNGTDKFGFHDYTPNYHALFTPWRDKPVRVLEIGVGGYGDEDRGGQSLATWRDYFPQGQITGLDLQKKRLDFGPRVRIVQGSQVDPDVLARTVAEQGPFDIIIDDGSHRNEHVVESFRLLWPTLVPGGIYVAEDVQTAFMPRFGGSITLTQPNSVGFFVDLFTGAATVSDLTGMARYHNMIALMKAGAPCPGAAEATPAPAAWQDSFAALPDGAELEFADPDADLWDVLRAAWIEVDHREIAVAYPAHVPHRLAPMISAVFRAEGKVRLRRGDNSYPSNFAYEKHHPRAVAARAAMAKVLADPDAPEPGLLNMANMIATLDGRAAAAPWVDRLTALGSTARVYYRIAGGLALERKDRDRAADLFRAGVAHYPDEQGFPITLSALCVAAGDMPGGRKVIADALMSQPRRSALWLQSARLALRDQDHAAARLDGDKAVLLAPPPRRDQTRLALARAAHAAGAGDMAADWFAAADPAVLARDPKLRGQADALRTALTRGGPVPDLPEDEEEAA
jgi:hypothetical protein